jgi:drug/metabolite transporter (DMT)-like permease
MNNQFNNWKLGLSLSLLVVFFWATLPVALHMGLQVVDAWTLTWLRFFVAAIITLIVIFISGSCKDYKALTLRNWLWLLLAGFMLVANYVGFLLGLEKTTPANAQVLIQLAPLLMILGGVYIYKESFSHKQKLGALLLLVGMGLFFKDQLGTLLNAQYITGAIFLLFAAITWAIYALIQKKLQAVLTPQSILAGIYVLATLLLFPTITSIEINELQPNQWYAIGYACLNTVGAYGAFAQALKYWQASKVGMVIAMVPVFTLLFINYMSSLFPELVKSEQIHTYGLIGIILIVLGSMTASIGKK